MAAKVALQNFDFRYTTLVFLNSTLHYGVELFLLVFNYNVIINKDVFNSNLVKVTRQYVLFGRDVTELEQILETLSELEMENSGKFITVCDSHLPHDCDESKIINLFWEYKIVNMVIIKLYKDQALGYTYYPISDSKCNNVKPIKLDPSNNSQYSTTNQGKIFGMKFKKLNLCPLFVSTFIQTPYMKITNGVPTGADGDLLRIISYALNTSMEIMTPHRGSGWGYREKNGTWMGSLADIYKDLANISMTSAALTLTRFSDFQVSRTYCTVHVVWITHPATLQNAALKLLHPFRQDARIALIVSYILVILCAFVVKTDLWASLCMDNNNSSPPRSVVFYSWMICMGQAIIKLPTKSAWLQVTILWIFYCFLVRTAYQVYLISSLKGKFYEDQLETIEDAIKANYPFGGGAALRDYYIDYPAVYDNWVNINTEDIVPTVLNISKGRKFVIAMNWDTAKIVIKTHKVSLHILPQKVVSSPTGIFFKRYSPLAESINLILSRLTSSGLPDKLHKNYTTILPQGQDNNEQETLKMVHFTACYAVLIIGWIVSLVFFSLEIYFGKIYRHPMCSP